MACGDAIMDGYGWMDAMLMWKYGRIGRCGLERKWMEAEAVKSAPGERGAAIRDHQSASACPPFFVHIFLF